MNFRSKLYDQTGLIRKAQSIAAWWNFAVLVLSAIAAAFGGITGTSGLSYIRSTASATP